MAFAATRSQSQSQQSFFGMVRWKIVIKDVQLCYAIMSWTKISEGVQYLLDLLHEELRQGPPSTSNIYQLYLCNNNLDIVLFQNIQTTTTKILWLTKLIFLASSIILGELFSPQVDIAWLRLYPTLGAVFRIWYTLNQVIAASTKKISNLVSEFRGG